MENSKKIIIISILFLLTFLMLFGIIRFYPTINQIYLTKILNWNVYKHHNIEFFYLKPKNPQKIILIIPDQRMDKYWNTYNIETNNGLKLAHFFYNNGFIPILYDRLDAHQEPHIFYSRKKLKKQLTDLIQNLIEWKNNNDKNLELILLTHGDGCNLGLSIGEELPIFSKIILINCGYENSLLDYYLELILKTMEITSVESKVIAFAKEEIEQWKNQNTYNKISLSEWQEIQKQLVENKVHPDIIALKKTLNRFQLPENIDFLYEAKNINFYSLLESIIQKNIYVFHFISEKDEEMPESTYKFIIKKSMDLNQKFYTLFKLYNTDHYLFYLDKKLSTPMEILLHRNNPFNEISMEFLQNLLKIL